MKLVSIRQGEKDGLGIKTGQGIIDIQLAAAAHPEWSHAPGTVMEAIRGGEEALDVLRLFARQLESTAIGQNLPAYLKDEEALEWGPCVTDPGKIICVGLNYKKHAAETGAAIPTVPILFSKFSNTLSGHRDEVPIPKVSEKVDYEVELAIVIGKTAKDVEVSDALDYVLGYCAANDVSARDLQLRTGQWMLGKTCDGFCPLGPYLVTADEVGDPNQLNMATIVNGEVRQNSNTSDMIFNCNEIVSYISRHMTLYPGDVILTGTPEGVVMGYPPEKQIYLKDGDVVTVEIDKLGKLTNTFVRE
jgi:2-keto-4-pentenoate hydratase/2-oxohepta-3-ene-1,7-dioic acid hydratase in catechol pathway